MRDLSIEYAHIYTNDRIGEEHELSLNTLREFKNRINLKISLVIMVDDYSFPDPSFDYSDFVSWLTEEGFKPDIVFRESQLVASCDEVLKMLKDNKLKAEIESYIKTKKKYPCSLFIAAWYLLRLGYISFPLFGNEFVAKKLMNVLPSSFRPFEDKAFEIISKTDFSNAVSKIENTYFDGRLVI
jgi:hypothetical protein